MVILRSSKDTLKLKFGFSFGSHGNSEDLLLAHRIREFKPQVYVRECWETEETQRSTVNLSFRGGIKHILDLPLSVRKERLVEIIGSEDFEFHETKIIIENGLVPHMIEGHEPEILATIRAAHDARIQFIRGIIYFMATQPKLSVAAYRDIVTALFDFQRQRDHQVAQRLANYSAHLSELNLPDLSSCPELRVFVRYGLMHKNVVRLFESLGGKVEFVDISDSTDLMTKVYLEVFEMERTVLSERQLGMLLFELVFGNVLKCFSEGPGREAKMELALDKIGGPIAFPVILSEIASGVIISENPKVKFKTELLERVA